MRETQCNGFARIAAIDPTPLPASPVHLPGKPSYRWRDPAFVIRFSPGSKMRGNSRRVLPVVIAAVGEIDRRCRERFIINVIKRGEVDEDEIAAREVEVSAAESSMSAPKRTALQRQLPYEMDG